MQKKCNILILVTLLLVSTLVARAEEGIRKFSKSWPAAEVETLMITNKFGEVAINSNGGNMVTIEVVVTVRGNSSRDRELLEAIRVTFGKNGRAASAVTEIEGLQKTRSNFSIDYSVNIPAEKNLVVNNKFGNVVINRLTGQGDFDIAYGNFTATELAGNSLALNLEYGKGDIGTLRDALISLSYGKLFFGTAGRIKIDSKYSTVNGDKVRDLLLDSKYDTFNFGEVFTLEGESKFTNYRIGRLDKRLKLESGYGTVKVDRIPADFELLEVSSSYAQVSLGIEEGAAYDMEASCEFCSITYPSEAFRGNRQKENTRESLRGKVAGGASGKVKVISKYGNIRLMD